MGALPKRKISKGRRDRRRAHDALSRVQMVSCPHCHEFHLPHHICPHCGTFRGVKYIAGDKEE